MLHIPGYLRAIAGQYIRRVAKYTDFEEENRNEILLE